ncbi:MAG: phage head morphogenesis protein, partial [Bacteroidaceae bacterium]|nr:phage head morphogenesis protein [Bacteroidaceae bacterium]
MGLHQRYASLLEGQPLDFIAGRKEEEDKLRSELTRLFDGMMETLYKQEGANLNITILETPKAQEFIEAHAGALDSSFKQVEMSDLMRRRLERSN